MAGVVVAVTGANGFIGSHIVRELLSHSNTYKVIGTIRHDPNSTDELVRCKFSHLWELPNAHENLRLVQANLLEEGSFDLALSECQYCIHTACPFYLTPTIETTDNAENQLLIPAVRGTRNVLNSVEKYRSQIKRIVVTSSTGALIGFGDRVFGQVYSETDWNTKSTLVNNPFAYSKTMAEREAWKWHEEMKEKYGHDTTEVVSLNPVLVMGPFLQIPRIKTLGISELSFSIRLLYNHVMKSKIISTPDGKTTKADGFSIVDVRDVALAHRLALHQPSIAGHRFVLVSEKYQWISMSRAIVKKYPFIDSVPLIIKDEMDEEEGLYKMLNFSNSKFLNYFHDFTFIPVENSILDTTACFVDNGFMDDCNCDTIR